MATLSHEVYAKLRRLVHNAEGNRERRAQLEKVLWYSFAMVYPNYMYESKKLRAEYSKVHRYRARINSYIDWMQRLHGDLYLVTLTYGDCYDSTSFDTRKTYARRWLNQCCLDYYACLDIGKANGRQHYHAICAINPDELEAYQVGRKTFYRFKSDKNWRFGYFTIEKIAKSGIESRKTSKYVFKASAYAFKAHNPENRPFHKRGAQSGWIELPATIGDNW